MPSEWFVITGLWPVSNGTAGCGPACPVVGDPWLIEQTSVSHGDPIRKLYQIGPGLKQEKERRPG